LYDIKGGGVAFFAGVGGGVNADAAVFGEDEEEDAEEEEARKKDDDEDDDQKKTAEGNVHGGSAASASISAKEPSLKKQRVVALVPTVAPAKKSRETSNALGIEAKLLLIKQTFHIVTATSCPCLDRKSGYKEPKSPRGSPRNRAQGSI
jgi:hypothetical protein